jgi:uncharacterized protein involved in exopolysaccharide biosynthesis
MKGKGTSLIFLAFFLLFLAAFFFFWALIFLWTELDTVDYSAIRLLTLSVVNSSSEPESDSVSEATISASDE